jgi:CRP-like cAMP-binding protein
MIPKVARDPSVISPISGPNGDGNKKMPIENEILLALPEKERAAVFAKLEAVNLPTHAILNEAEQPIKFGYFIDTGMASVLNVLSDGKMAEVGLTGKEGFVGLPLLAGFSTSPTRVVMQIAGRGHRIRSADLLEMTRTQPLLDKFLQRYLQELNVQTTQVAICNLMHEVDERLARWLLMCQDRIGTGEILLTQEFLSQILGTRRASVTVAAGILQKARIISYSRGKVKIAERRRLEQSACECYGKVVRLTREWRKEQR